MRAAARIAAIPMVLAVLAACGGSSRPPADEGPAADAAADAPDAATADSATADAADAPDAATADSATADAAPDALPPAPHADLADPRIGTGGQGWWAGSASVGAQAPFGMVQAGPDGTDEYGLPWDHCSGFNDRDTRILAFSNEHLHGVGIPDMGAVGFMPFRGAMAASRLGDGHAFGYDRDSLDASPGYFAVTLDDPGVRVELTASEVAAVHRYAFPPGAAAGPMTVLVDVAHAVVTGDVSAGDVEVRPDAREVRAHARMAGEFSRGFGGMDYYVVARFDRPFAAFGTWQGADVGTSVASRTGPDTGAFVTLDDADGAPIEVRVGVSFVDLDGAARNLDALPGGFDATFAATRAAWEAALSKVRCDGGGGDRQRLLYTALYHAQMMPNRFMDADGRYRGFDRQVHASADGTVYHTNFSLWDTYRGDHSLLALLQPLRQRDMVRSLVRMAAQGGYLPKWAFGTGYTNVMIGSPADMVVAETYLKGITDFDVEAAYASMKVVATTAVPAASGYKGRQGVEDYVALGYVPVDRWDQSVSRTLEFAIADAAIANLAHALGRTDDEAVFRARAGNWRNLFDADAGYFLPRRADGTFDTDVDPLNSPLLTDRPYTEGDALQYLWLVPQDPEGLRDAMGGAQAMATRLQSFFEEGKAENEAIFAEAHDPLWWMTNPPKHYWQGNEPDFHAAYLFDAAGRPDLAQQWLRWIETTLYTTGRDGIPGNDDAGAMSAWWVWSALGLFPVPGSDRYWLGGPLFDRCEVDLPGGGTLVIDAPGAADTPTWTRATWNGTPIDGYTLRHADIAGGGTLAFTMTGR